MLSELTKGESDHSRETPAAVVSLVPHKAVRNPGDDVPAAWERPTVLIDNPADGPVVDIVDDRCAPSNEGSIGDNDLSLERGAATYVLRRCWGSGCRGIASEDHDTSGSVGRRAN